MSVETTNPGFVDSAAYRADPVMVQTPDNFHNEYFRGQMSYLLSQVAADAAAVPYVPTNPADWPDPDPATVQEGLDDLAGTIAHPVLSVFGRTGVVAAAASDYDASQVDNDSGVSGAFVSDALDSLNANIVVFPGIETRFNTATGDADPGSGRFSYDNATQNLATTVYMSKTTGTGADIANFLLLLKSGDTVYYQETKNAGKYHVFTVSGAVIDAVGYVKIPVTSTSFGTSLANNDKCTAILGIGGGAGGGGLNGTGVTQTGVDSNAGGTVVAGGAVLDSLGDSSLAFGRSSGATSIIRSGGVGSLAFGWLLNGGTIESPGNGSIAFGNMTSTGLVAAQSTGSMAFGNSQTGGIIRAFGTGNLAFGSVQNALSEIKGGGPGSLTFGYAENGSIIETANRGSSAFGFADADFDIRAIADGAMAFGRAIDGNILASGNGAIQVGQGTNSVTDSIQFGANVFRVDFNAANQRVIMANLPTSDPTNTGELWNDSGTLKVSA